MPVRKYSIAKDILRFEGLDKTAYWKRFTMLLSLAVIVSTMGLLRDSGAVVIAAMLIAPLMAPILGIASAMVIGRTKRAFRLLLIVCLASVASVLLAWLLVFMADIPRGVIIPGQVLARTDPGIEELIVALAAGVAGAYVQIQRAEISLLPGAAIGVSLVPPLSAAGILMYFGQWADAYEAALLFTTNLGAIILAASLVYMFSGGFRSVVKKARRVASFSLSFLLTSAVMVVILMQLSSATIERYREKRNEAVLADHILEWADPVSIEIIRLNVKPRRKLADIWLIVDLPVESQYTLGSVADLLPSELRQKPLSDVIQNVLGSEYTVAVRYQTRIAGLINLTTDQTNDAPSPDDLIGEE
ncbi:DUF389 domain-containing protein [Falsiphaeobacter marinintestinus]|uniref:DUF389 domain-containing protein n=1 Tax=Falsiphaeobacter marinintestinus TaxID=1492905 RepID=UPI0011B4DDB4|nr:DUF389 domain-containing protein [Phaeobacter marinintestinus]